MMKGKAIDVVCGELDKLAMCKRGTLKMEESERGHLLNRELNDLEEPILSVKRRKVIFSRERKRLLRILKYRPSEKLCHFANSYHEGRLPVSNMHTKASIIKYNEECMRVLMHPGHGVWVLEKAVMRYRINTLIQEMQQREAILDAEFKEAKMSFISESTSLKDFTKVYDRLEAEVW